MSFEVGTLVRARGREWVVLPNDSGDPEIVMLRPLGGTEDWVTGIFTPLEKVEEARFTLPDPSRELGGNLSCRLLRDAVRLGFRSGAGPFRSLARIGIEPRPYQLVPLLMALRLDPVRLLIADDVGVGKTVEACLVARELLDRGEVHRLAVLCPPHLAEQWQRALADQFHLDATLVLSGTAARLEREIIGGESIFERHPITVVSTDFIKKDSRRVEFLRACPELVIVDEAHTCASASGRGARQQRHELLRDLARDEGRHLVLVTATPHSGKEDAFHSLLGLLDAKFVNLPDDLSGDQNRKHRDALARHLVQRRRGDLQDYLGAKTPFPDREVEEVQYDLHSDYLKLFERVWKFCRERVEDDDLTQHHRRVRIWSALALLRSLASSPDAAESTLTNRASVDGTESVEEADEIGCRAVFDLDNENAEGADVIPGAQLGEESDEGAAERKRMLDMARQAKNLAGNNDKKLAAAEKVVRKLLDEGHSPILFCRFIPTVRYVAEALRKKLGKKVAVEAVTGALPPEAREQVVEELGKKGKRVLVCTDCLSEGINLQHSFDAVVHYDLSWNPTRHEQREGRVDRYGQQSPKVKTVILYSQDNPVDGHVLQVLIRKHRAIHKQLGIIVPVPMDTEAVQKSIAAGILFRSEATARQITFEFMGPEEGELFAAWDAAADREKKSRRVFAQHSIKVEEVAKELEDTRRALGGEETVERFVVTALRALDAVVTKKDPSEVNMEESPAAVRDLVDGQTGLQITFSSKPARGVTYLTRTHSFVEGLSSLVMETALDVNQDGPGKRCGVVRTEAVSTRTTLLLLRLRYHIVSEDRSGTRRALLAEDQVLAGFTGSPKNPEWLAQDALESLLDAPPAKSIGTDIAREHLQGILDDFDAIAPRLNEVAEERGQALLEAHNRVRKAAKARVKGLKVEAHLPPDVLGVYVYLPANAGGAS